MRPVRRLSIIDQTADHLREGIRSGRWKDILPGVRPLSAELDVSRESLRRALRRLETEGLLDPGSGQEVRRIAPGAAALASPAEPRPVRVALLLPRGFDGESVRVRLRLLRLVVELQAAGHACSFVSLPPNTDTHKTGQLARLVETTGADAWIVCRGTVEILEWFAGQPVPALAFGGRTRTVSIASAGYDPQDAIRDAVRRLTGLGHRRIVYVCSHVARVPTPSYLVQAFRDELQASGVKPGEYNTPDWDETPEGFHKLMESLFKVTPPTALILWTSDQAHAALSFIARRGLEVPRDVSLATMEDDSNLRWQHPELRPAHIEENEDLYMRRIIRWVSDCALGRQDREHRLAPSTFNPGNTFGPAKK